MLVASLDLNKNNIRKFKYYARLGNARRTYVYPLH